MSHFQGLQGQGGQIAGFEIDTAKSTASSNALEQKYGTRDGAKVFLTDGSWLLIRASGTEPIARVYVEGVADTVPEALNKSQTLLDAITTKLTNEFWVSEANIKEKK
jgi:phosphomannomutase